MSDHCIDDGEELAHAGGKSDFLLFSGGNEALVMGTDNRIVSACDQSPHVEDGSHVGSATPTGTFAADSAAVPVKRSDTDESGDLPAVERPELWKVRHQHRRKHWTNSRHTLEKIFFSLQIGLALMSRLSWESISCSSACNQAMWALM